LNAGRPPEDRLTRTQAVLFRPGPEDDELRALDSPFMTQWNRVRTRRFDAEAVLTAVRPG
jgi:hypothetical protein